MILRVGYEDHPMMVKVKLTVTVAGNLEYLQSHVVDRYSLLSEREVEKFCGQDGKRLYSQPSEN